MEIQQEQLFWYSPSKSIFDPKQKHTLRRVKLSTFLTSKRIVSHLYYIWGKGFNFSSLSILQKKIQTKIPKINVLPRTQLIIIYLLNSIDKKKIPITELFILVFNTSQVSTLLKFTCKNQIAAQGLENSLGDIISYLSFKQMATLDLSWMANSSDLGSVFQARTIYISFPFKEKNKYIGIGLCKKGLKYKCFNVLHFIYKCLHNYFCNRTQDTRNTEKTEQATISRTRRLFCLLQYLEEV